MKKEHTQTTLQTEEEQEPIYFKAMGRILWYCLVDWFFYRLSNLTRVYPLSKYLWKYPFHYRFREEKIVQDMIFEKSMYYFLYTHIYLVESDQYFVHAFIQVFRNKSSSSREILRSLQREVGKSNLYISKFSKTIYKLDFVKDNLNEEMLLHRKIINF